jgi:hypothetical protein
MNARIYVNAEYTATEENVKELGKYLFVAEEGAEAELLHVWIEKSKANEANPDGKPWIILPKGNICNRKYFSEQLFNTSVNEEGFVEVEVKTSAPRILGASGVKAGIVKYLNEAEAAEYTELVETAVATYKELKAGSKKIKPEDMNPEQLQEYITALQEGRSITMATGPSNWLEVFDETQYDRYNELLAISVEAKANAPKAVRAKLTDEQKEARTLKRTAKKISHAQDLLAAFMAQDAE